MGSGAKRFTALTEWAFKGMWYCYMLLAVHCTKLLVHNAPTISLHLQSRSSKKGRWTTNIAKKTGKKQQTNYFTL